MQYLQHLFNLYLYFKCMMTTPKDLLTLESVRPGLTAKGSFKNSKPRGNTLLSITSLSIPKFSLHCQKWTGKCSMSYAPAVRQQLFSPSFFPLAVFSSYVFLLFFKIPLHTKKSALQVWLHSPSSGVKKYGISLSGKNF